MRMEISLKKKVMFYKFTFYYLYFTILLFLKYKTVLRSICQLYDKTIL